MKRLDLEEALDNADKVGVCRKHDLLSEFDKGNLQSIHYIRSIRGIGYVLEINITAAYVRLMEKRNKKEKR